jgi:alpha-ribazole phosphatase
MTCFWWVRHAPTHARCMVGWSDLPADLSDRPALNRLAAFLPAGAPIVASDLARARDTARAIAGDRQVLDPDPRLREIHFGDWEMRGFDEIEAQDPDRIRAFWDRPGDIRPPNGESWNEASARVAAAVQALSERALPDVIVVAHFGPIVAQIQQALELTAREAFGHRIGNLSVTRITLSPPAAPLIGFQP